ncbi:MAG: hypothetical protein PHE26_13365 [Syntrophomonadaceae bacterium]|nr:hypothetical protein [Syntrophomonadaceae bacterium]
MGKKGATSENVYTLKHKAKIKATHYSTAIEGNPLTIQQVEETVEKKLVKNKGEQSLGMLQ